MSRPGCGVFDSFVCFVHDRLVFSLVGHPIRVHPRYACCDDGTLVGPRLLHRDLPALLVLSRWDHSSSPRALPISCVPSDELRRSDIFCCPPSDIFVGTLEAHRPLPPHPWRRVSCSNESGFFLEEGIHGVETPVGACLGRGSSTVLRWYRSPISRFGGPIIAGTRPSVNPGSE